MTDERKCKYCGKAIVSKRNRIYCNRECTNLDMVSPQRAAVWKARADNPEWTTARIAKELGVGVGTVRNALFNVPDIPKDVGVKKKSRRSQ